MFTAGLLTVEFWVAMMREWWLVEWWLILQDAPGLIPGRSVAEALEATVPRAFEGLRPRQPLIVVAP